jgi:putative SOS response-associated peptidase YedK
MCGRTSLGVSKQALENHYQAKMPGSFQPTYNAAPGQTLPIVRNLHPERIELARWGFLPEWLRKRHPAGFINTRVETALEKPSFREALLYQRCLVPVDGFFEWTPQKQPYYFTLSKHGIFSLAGIWQAGTDDDGKKEITYSILTTKADERMEKIHDRMPLVLDSRQEKIWLEKDLSPEDLGNIDKWRTGLLLTSYPVDKQVNSSSLRGPQARRRL